MEISDLLKSGQKVNGKFCRLIWKESDDFRWGVFLQGKSAIAAKRNRIKRLFREAIRLNRQKLEKNVKIAVLPYRSLVEADFHEIDAEISRIFEQI